MPGLALDPQPTFRWAALMLTYVSIFLLVVAITEVSSLRHGSFEDQFRIARGVVVSAVEWFGELGMFCARLFRALLAPPFEFRVATRVLACILMLPLLTIAADFCGIFMGWVANTMAQPVSLRLFVERGFKDVTFSDFIPPTLKTAVFGFIIGIVACFQGMRTRGGTEGVGRSATSSVVLSSLFVILADVVLVRLILVVYG